MKEIICKPKYSIYPFEYPNGIKGQIRVLDKHGVDVIIKQQTTHFKNFEKAMLFVHSQLNKNL